MPSRWTGEASLLLTFGTAGSTCWIHGQRYGNPFPCRDGHETLCLQIDADRAVAAGASWGGYAIKYESDQLTGAHDRSLTTGSP
jgi:hypothetical protein